MSKSAVEVDWSVKAKVFDSQNPHIYEKFKELALMLINNGVTRYSAIGIFMKMTFDLTIQTKSTDCYKINANYTAYYSRKFMDDYPQYPNFFRTKRIAADMV